MTLAGVTLVEVAALPAGAQPTGRVKRPKFRDGEPMDCIEGCRLGGRRFEVYTFASGRVPTYELVKPGSTP